MNANTSDYLVSPVSQGACQSLKTLTQGCDQTVRGELVYDGDPHHYQIVATIPLLAPPGSAYEWRHPTLDVLLGGDARKYARYGTAARMKMAQDLARTRSRDDVRALFTRPAEPRTSSAGSTRDRGAIHGIPAKHYYRGLSKTRKAGAERRLRRVRELANGWASLHLGTYVDEINHCGGGILVELGTGLGLGTVAIMDRVRGFERLFTVDIDFPCSKNVDGYARILNMRGRTEPLVAAFESLPLGDGTVDMVVTHYGLDESANVTAVLADAARVLRPRGRLVGVGRTVPFGQHRQLFEGFEFRERELVRMASAADVYPGYDQLVKIAQRLGLRCADPKEFRCPETHDRVVFVFEKA